MVEQIRTIIATAVPENQRQKFMADFSEKLRSQLRTNDIVNDVVPVYARHFSLDEIQELTRFYESSVGKRFVQMLPQVIQESQIIGEQIGQKVISATLAEMSGRYPDLKQLLQANTTPPTSTPPTSSPPQQK
jgi:hypothetical protein